MARPISEIDLTISIHAPRAGRDREAIALGFAREISIHAPRAGRDTKTPYGVIEN